MSEEENIQSELQSTIQNQISQIDQLSTQAQFLKNDYQIQQEKNSELKKQLTEMDIDMEDLSYDPMEEILAMQKELVDVTFGYSEEYGLQEDTKMRIKGEFNNWQSEQMTKVSKNVFVFKTKVLAGYKYRFQCFWDDSESPSIDRYQPIAYSLEVGDYNSNYKYVIKTQNNSPNGPSSSEQELLQKLPEYLHPEMKKKYLEKFNENTESINQLAQSITPVDFQKVDQLDLLDQDTKLDLAEKSLLRNQNLNKQLEIFRLNEKLAIAAQEKELASETKEKLIQVNAEIEKLSQVILNPIRGRYAKSRVENSPSYFMINSYNPAYNEIRVSKIYDPNGILILDTSHSYSNRVCIDDGTFFQNYQVLTTEEQAVLVKDTFSDSHALIMKYQVVDVDGEKSYLCIETNPAGLNLKDDYIVYQDRNGFPDQINHMYSGEIKTKFINLGTENTHPKPQTIQIYTSEHSPHALNIFHIHLIDHNEKQQHLEAYYLRDDQTAQEFEAFQPDAIGQLPIYKLLVQNQNVIAFLYNGENGAEYLEFTQVKIAQNGIYEISGNNSHLLSDQSMICQIANIPQGLIVSLDQQSQVVQDQPQYNLHSFCHHRLHYQQWQGFVDVNIKSLDSGNSILKNDINLAYPVCVLTEPSEYTLEQYQAIMKD
ncbi:UNKNOWN [Stylonychia lemnae]|uniref:Uncharacterized protein n=1 Tax=Stylonychia lemnae TaxID=5949 RepID=A0A078B371_STYLE|nr:UNKNOWN [Stylonychia lemnae]|eukprot:CDW88970.1 UNKNOWN [Stylonychia lemnae]